MCVCRSVVKPLPIILIHKEANFVKQSLLKNKYNTLSMKLNQFLMKSIRREKACNKQLSTKDTLILKSYLRDVS